MVVLLLTIASLAMVFVGFYYWARKRGLITRQAAEGEPGTGHIPLLTEAVAYVGAILILAAGVAAVGQRWQRITGWQRVGLLAGAALLFLLAGIVVRRIREPAIQRMVAVVWFLSVAAFAGAGGFAAHDVYGTTPAVTALAIGVAVTVYSGALWLASQHPLQNIAMFAGLIATICGGIFTADESAPSMAFALVLWGFGLTWASLGWRRYVQPLWVTVPSGVVLALLAPSLAVADYGWAYAIGITTAAAAMAASVRSRNTPLLALGALAMFGYVTSVVLRYFHQSLGVPGALAITGVLVLGLAVVTSRLMRLTRLNTTVPAPKDSTRLRRPPMSREPGAADPRDNDLPRAS